jgi:hypothetical protein
MLAVFLMGFVALSQLLLGAFLGIAWPLLFVGLALSGLILVGCFRARGWGDGRVSATTLLLAYLISIGLFALGGEGRLFYANIDWQVRNAVLHDLVVQPWPWAYTTESGLQVLRCPLGMYLLPALVGKVLGERAAEFALLFQNAMLLAVIMGLASVLYGSRRERLLTLVLFLGFGGMDILGQLLFGRPLISHLEGWAGLQYTAPLTLAFWVPQHMLAGWGAAALYLLWRRGAVPLAAVLAYVPLGLLLSPLAMIGFLPFVVWAALETILSRRLVLNDLVVPGLATILTVPSLLYLGAGADQASPGTSSFSIVIYIAFYLLEVAPFLAILWLARDYWRFDRPTMMIVVALLLLLPAGRIGTSTDFVMRASIVPIDILALAVTDILLRQAVAEASRFRTSWFLALIVFVIGTAVPIGEIGRAILLPRAPAMLCGLFGILPEGAWTYVAPLESLSLLIRPPDPMIVSPLEPQVCWEGAWPDATANWWEGGSLAGHSSWS